MLASIIIPTRNRANELLATLQSIVKQTSLTDIEIVIVDNGSKDDTLTIVSGFAQQLPIVYDYCDIPGLLTGRHRGAEIAKGEVLCFLDDDVELNPNFTKNLLEIFSRDQDVQLATGPCLPNFEIAPLEWLSYFWSNTTEGSYCAWLSLLDFGQQEIEINPNFVWGLNFSIRKSAFIELGGFHPDCIPDNLQQFQGDGETGLTIKAIAKNYKAFYIPGLALKHYVPAGRLTHAYFRKRAFYQGVCNSYTSIRQEHNKVARTKNPFGALLKKVYYYYRWIRANYKKEKKSSLPENIEELMVTLRKSEKDGFDFHQNHFKNDYQVKQWVLKENYWDYKLPL